MTTQTVVDQIIQVIEYLGQKFGIAIDWSAENLVPVAEHLGSRIIDWSTVSSIAWIIICATVVVTGIIVTIAIWRKIDKVYDCTGFVVLIAVSILAIVGFGAGLFVNIFELIKCLTFPELKILEYIQSFMQ